MKAKIIKLIVIGMVVLCLNSCVERELIVGPNDPSPLPTAPSSMPELIVSLSDPDYEVRLTAIAALRDKGPDAEDAVPALIVTLKDDVGDIRVLSADALGEIGPGANLAVPVLLETLKFDTFAQARVSAAIALGKIGDSSAVPILAEILWDESAFDADIYIPIKAAWAIAQLTQNPFPDSELGDHGYRVNDNGEPLIVLAAREWWESEGQLENWDK